MTARKLPAASRRRRAGKFDKGHLDRGAAAVEMALVMPLLILMVMGIIDFGRIFNGEIQLSQAAREGARIAALGASGPYDTAAVQTRTKAALTNPAFQGNTAVVYVYVVSSPSDEPTSGQPQAVCADATGYGYLRVRINYQKILFGPAELSQKAVMKCAG